ncbi:MAG: ATP-binding cassette domain-containing protein [Psychromonas sp.]|nr:ATP-binding cassette domain-containing protein [Psychromonas sp.]
MQTLLNISNLCKNYRRSTGFFTSRQIIAFGPVNFTLERGKTLALMGKSGSGKSALIEAIAGITKPTFGEIYFKGRPLSTLSKKDRHKSIRMIFNDPIHSLNAKATIGTTLLLPLKLNTNLLAIEQKRQIKDVMKLVNLSSDYLNYYPNILSIYQLHQVAIARAMILNPEIIIADEVLATLDISLRFKIINLLLTIQEKRNISYIFISHNIKLARHLSDNIIVLNNGLIIKNTPV